MSNNDKFRNPEAYYAKTVVQDTPCYCRGVYVSAAGALEFICREGEDAITVDVVEGFFPVFVYQVNSAGTTATVLGLD